jgi:hypothetical protein
MNRAQARASSDVQFIPTGPRARVSRRRMSRCDKLGLEPELQRVMASGIAHNHPTGFRESAYQVAQHDPDNLRRYCNAAKRARRAA